MKNKNKCVNTKSDNTKCNNTKCDNTKFDKDKYNKEQLKELKDTDYLDQIYDHILRSAISEIKAYHKANKKFFKTREDFADYIEATDSMIQKLLAKKIRPKNIASIKTLLKICDKLEIPIKIEYEIGLHSCYYTSKNYNTSKRNIHSGRYDVKKLSVEEIKRRTSNGEPYFHDYEPKEIHMSLGNHYFNYKLDEIEDEEKLKRLLEYEKTLNKFISSIGLKNGIVIPLKKKK